jgi:signal transduction histidine kinase
MGVHSASAILPAPATGGPRRSPTSRDGWTRLVSPPTEGGKRRRTVTVRRVVVRFAVADLLLVAVLLVGSFFAANASAVNAALDGATRRADVLAEALVVPSLTEQVAAGDPVAIEGFGRQLTDRLKAAGIVRAKLWAADGTVLWSDEPSYIGKYYGLSDDDQNALADGRTRAEVSNLDRPENTLERPIAGRMLEVYRRVETPSGTAMLFETYTPYDQTDERAQQIFAHFAPISAAVLLTLFLVQLPLAHRMVSQVRDAQRERTLLAARAADASADERRRIAGNLHDGIVQDVSAACLLVSRASDQLRSTQPGNRDASAEVAGVLSDASTALRGSVSSLRSLLLEIYPPHLARAGLASALADLAARTRARGIEVRTTLPDDLDVPLEQATLVFRVAQESLANVAKHAGACTVDVVVTRTAGRLVLEVTDDGAGFDAPAALGAPRKGHLGLSVLTDLARSGGASLDLRSAPGHGTALRLEVALP